MKEIITARMPAEETMMLITVLYEDQKPVEIYAEPVGSDAELGCIYIGKVDVIDPRLQAAFVRIGKEKKVYLPLGKEHTALKSGDEIAVQIIQEAQKTKLPKVTTAYELTGAFMIVSREPGGLSFSRKLSSEDRKRLQKAAEGFYDEKFHILFRTRAEEAAEEELKQEYTSLSNQLDQLQLRAATRSCFTCLYQAPGFAERLIQSCAPNELKRFSTDDRNLWEKLFHDTVPPENMVFYEDPALDLFRLHNFSTLLSEAISKEVHLKSGGTLIIEQTEAFTAIDVNSSRYTGRKTDTELKMLINREAAYEAARQIRLRQLSGTILIDFINTKDAKEEQELSQILQSCFIRDSVYTQYIDFSRLHICEITRKKRNRSLSEQLRRIRNIHA